MFVIKKTEVHFVSGRIYLAGSCWYWICCVCRQWCQLSTDIKTSMASIISYYQFYFNIWYCQCIWFSFNDDLEDECTLQIQWILADGFHIFSLPCRPLYVNCLQSTDPLVNPVCVGTSQVCVELATLLANPSSNRCSPLMDSTKDLYQGPRV